MKQLKVIVLVAKSIAKDKRLSDNLKIVCMTNCIEKIEEYLNHPMRKGEYK